MCIYITKFFDLLSFVLLKGPIAFVVAMANRSYGCASLQVDDIVRAAKRACYRAVPMAAAA